MREIKFRQPILQYGKFYCWHYWGFVDGKFIEPKLSNYECGDSQQFTGLSDKNKQPIYEGDVIRKKCDRRTYYGKKYDGAIAVVKYSSEGIGFYFHLIKGDEWSFYYPEGENWHQDELEIIGNIHEHPHLLESK